MNVRVGGKWVTVCNLEPIEYTKGYFGFTSFSGKGGFGERHTEPAVVSVAKLSMVNHDEHHLGDLVDSENDPMLKEILGENFKYESQADQTKAIARLKMVLEKHMTSLQDRTLLTKLVELGDKTQNLEAKVGLFKQEVRVILGSSNKKAGLGDLRNELRGLKSMIKHESADHHEKVEAARKTAQLAMTVPTLDPSEGSPQLEKFHASREELEKMAHSTNTLFYMFVCIIVAVGVTVGAIYRKMKSYEKKHFL